MAAYHNQIGRLNTVANQLNLHRLPSVEQLLLAINGDEAIRATERRD
jgi:hypothetical protein